MSRKESAAGLSLESVLKNISDGRGVSCYLLYGDEEFLVEEALGKVVDALIPMQDRELNLFVMSGESGAVDAVCEALQTPPLIPGPKVVVLRKTRLFYSKSSLPELVRKITAAVDTDLAAAARAFMVFLDVAGWSLEELRDDGWRRITDGQWNELTEGEGGEGRAKWLPRVLEYCLGQPASALPRPGGTEALEELVSSGFPEGHYLVMTADAVDRRKKLFKAVADGGAVLSFARTRSEAAQRGRMEEALREQLVRSEKSMTPEARLSLGRKTGFRLRDSAEAVDLLITYTGERKTIEADDVERVIGRTRDDTVFDLTEALVGKELSKALACLGDLLYQAVHPLVILAMITREIRFLFHGKVFLDSGKVAGHRADMDFGQFQRAVYPAVKELQSGLGKGTSLAGQHPYVIYNALRHASRFSYGELTDRLHRVLAADVAMKSTGNDARLLLERLLVDLCGPAGRQQGRG